MVVVNRNGVKPFILERREARLTFEDETYAGLEITTKLDVSVEMYLEMQSLSSSSIPADMQKAFEKFGDEILISWNFQDVDGEMIPPTAQGFLTLPPTVAVEVMKAWSEASGVLGKA